MGTKEPQQAIVVFNGCFCPVHAGHVKALMDTKRKVEAGGRYKVVAGYFAVATDGYVRSKVEKFEPWMSAEERVHICEAVSHHMDFSVSAAVFAGAKQCGKEMVAQHHTSSTQVFSVREEAKKGGVSKKGDIEIANGNLSSTAIRAELKKHNNPLEAVDNMVRKGWILNAVGECLKTKLAGVDEQHENQVYIAYSQCSTLSQHDGTATKEFSLPTDLSQEDGVTRHGGVVKERSELETSTL